MPFQRIALTLSALILLMGSVIAYRAEVRARAPYEEFVTTFELGLRRPGDVAAMRLQPAADLRAVFAAEMALEDIYGSVRLRDLDAVERAAWLRSVIRGDEEVRRARDLMLPAIEARPGWAFHHAMLSQLVYTASRRESPAAIARDRRLWERPSVASLVLARGNLSFAAFLAGAYLEVPGAATRTDAREVTRRAMKNHRFVERNYDLAASVLGRQEAIALMPDEPSILRIAFAREAKAKRVEVASLLRTRLDDAEWRTREEDLREIERLATLRDRIGVASAIATWLSRHRLEEIDTRAGRRQAARLLELWPQTRRGTWNSDPRASLVRFFLDGRESEAAGDALVRATDALSGVPEPVAAQVLARAGRPGAAEQRLLASQTRGSFEWTPAILAIANAHLDRGAAPKAQRILGELPPGAREECSALLTRRRAGPQGESEVAARLAMIDSVQLAVPVGRALSLCIDPSRHARFWLQISLHSEEPNLVSYGWDRGRLASIMVRRDAQIALPLADLAGRHVFSVRSEVGASVQIAGVQIE